MAITADKDVVDRLNDLIALDLDASAAYASAIERLKDETAKRYLTAFKADHDRHVQELSGLCRRFGGEPRQRGDAMQILTQGQVVLRSITGDKGVLKAMKSNEDQTNAYYEKAVAEQGLPAEVRSLFEKNLGDERRHREWIVGYLDKMG